jgi:hypothetical protein
VRPAQNWHGHCEWTWRTRKQGSAMFGLGILGTILLIVIVLWLLGVIG